MPVAIFQPEGTATESWMGRSLPSTRYIQTEGPPMKAWRSLYWAMLFWRVLANT